MKDQRYKEKGVRLAKIKADLSVFWNNIRFWRPKEYVSVFGTGVKIEFINVMRYEDSEMKISKSVRWYYKAT